MKFELAKVEQWNLGLSAGAVAASLALVTPHFATSLAAGAFLEALNLGAIHRTAKRLFEGQVMTGAWVGGFALRLMLLSVGIFAVMYIGAHPVALLIGLSIAMPATLIDAWLNRPPIVDPATLPTFLDDDLYADPVEDEDAAPRVLQAGNLFPLKWTDPLEEVESDAPASTMDPSDDSSDDERNR
jgi:hypothetical protein